MTSTLAPFDLYNTSTVQLQQLLDAGSLTSVKAVTAYLDQIARHNTAGLKLHAVIDTPPRPLVLKLAQALDDERAHQGARGPLHGVPVLVKVLDAKNDPVPCYYFWQLLILCPGYLQHRSRTRHGNNMRKWSVMRCKTKGELCYR
jgi:hypothetical protein